MSLLHKAIAIPVIDTGEGVSKFLIVHDKRYREWTFVTGGCRTREIYNPLKCALRELEEETRGVVNLKRGVYHYFRFDAQFEPLEQSLYHVYVFHISMHPSEMQRIETRFGEEKLKMDTNQVCFRKNYDENDNLKFLKLDEIKECSTLWKFISENILENKEFYDALDQVTPPRQFRTL
jgi:ADP-ribose pyrophosphatase YjhB (NUDIX family)